ALLEFQLVDLGPDSWVAIVGAVVSITVHWIDRSSVNGRADCIQIDAADSHRRSGARRHLDFDDMRNIRRGRGIGSSDEIGIAFLCIHQTPEEGFVFSGGKCDRTQFSKSRESYLHHLRRPPGDKYIQ